MRQVPYTHQLETTDEQFLDNLSLPGEAGRKLAAARKAGDSQQATAVVSEYFRTRKAPAWSFYCHGSAWHETDAPGSVIEKADNLLKHRFRNSWHPHQWADLNNGTEDPDWNKGMSEVATSITRGTFITELSTAFALSGNLAYAGKALQLLRSFIKVNPFVLHPRFEEDHDQFFGGRQDVTQTTSLRMFRMLDLMHCGAMHAGGVFTDADVFWLIKQLWFYTVQYHRFSDDAMRRDNHHLMDHGIIPFLMGIMFPEFAGGRELRERGAKVMRFHCGHNLLKDGAYAEHSAEYQYHITYGYFHPYGVAKANGYRLFSEEQVKALRKWAQFNACCCKPDGVLPAIGDSPGRPLAHFFATLCGPLMTPRLAAMARGLGFEPGEHLYVSSADVTRRMQNWKEGERLKFGISAYYMRTAVAPDPKQLPAPVSAQYPHGGYTFFRSNWSTGADYLAVSHFSGDYGGHAHWDPMSFILHTQGQTLIGEPASALYLDRRFSGHGTNPTQQDAAVLHRGYSYSVNSHNCLVMNDDFLKPLEAMNHGTFWGGYPPKHRTGLFKAGGPIEVAEVWNNANDITRHRRFFVHITGVGFVMVDLLSKRPNLSPNQYSQFYHFEGDVEIGPELPGDGQTIRASLDGAQCLIVPGTEAQTKWRTFRDQYLDDVYGVKESKGLPWVAELTRRIRGEAVFTNFVLTKPARDLTTAPTARYLGARTAPYLDWQHEGLSAHSLDLGAAGTLYVASCPYGKPLQSESLQTDAELAVVVIDASGRVKSWAMARGTKLSVNGKKLVRRRSEWVAG